MPKEAVQMVNPFNNNKSEQFHILPAQFRAGKPEAVWVDRGLKVVGGIVAIGGAILSFAAGARQLDDFIAQLRAEAEKK